MSLNCLTCSHVLEKTESFKKLFTEKEYREACKQVDRSWSGNMSSSSSPPSQREIAKGGAVAKIKANHRRIHSTGNIPSEPRLKRSSGMRRDWSFENLGETQDQRVTCH